MQLRQWDSPGGGQVAPLVQPQGGGGYAEPNIKSATGASAGFAGFTLAPDATNPALFGNVYMVQRAEVWVGEQDWTATSGPAEANQAGIITNPGTQNFTPVKRIFGCWRWEADMSFDHGADIQKYIRFMSGDWGTLILTLDQQWGDFPLLWDLGWGTGGGGQNQGTPINPNDLRGAPHWYEVELDMSVAGTATSRLWIDDVLKNVQTVSVDHSAYSIGSVQWYYTFNGPARNAFSWFSYPALSTQRIGMNWHL